MSAMILMSGLSNLGNSLSKQNLPARGSYAPGGYSQGGGMEDMLPNMLRVQAMQAQMQNQQQDNELQRKQFEFAQQTAAQKATLEQQRLEAIKRAVPGIVAATGQPAEVVEALLLGGVDSSNPLAQAVGDRSKTWSGAPGERRFDAQGNVIADNPAVLEVTPSGFADRRNAIYGRDPQMHADAMGRGQSGATRVYNQTNVTGNKMAEGVAASAVKPFDKLTEAAASANSRMEATRALYETAKLYPDLIGPGMELKAGVADMIEKAKKLADLGQVDPQTQRLLTVARVMEETRGKATTQVMRDLTGNDTDTEWLRTIRQFPGMDDTKLTHDMMFVRAKTESDYLNQKQAYVARKIAEAEATNTFGLTTASSAEREFEQANPLGDMYAKNLAAVLPASPASSRPAQVIGVQGATPPPVPQPQGGLSVDPDIQARANKARYR